MILATTHTQHLFNSGNYMVYYPSKTTIYMICDQSLCKYDTSASTPSLDTIATFSSLISGFSTTLNGDATITIDAANGKLYFAIGSNVYRFSISADGSTVTQDTTEKHSK